MIPAFLFFPPEINSALMYGGAGPGTLLTAASAWDALSADLAAAAASFDSVVTGLAAGPWMGPSSMAMVAAATPYLQWLISAAGQAEISAVQARLAASSYEAAFMATVPPPAVLENRIRLLTLIATNILGQNTPAIAMTELEYMEMWAQDVAAMVGYHIGAQTVASTLPAFSVPPASLNGLAGLITAPLEIVSQLLGGVGGAFISQLQSVLGAFSPLLTSVTSLLTSMPVTTMTTVAQIGMYPASALMSPMMALAHSVGPAAAPAMAGAGVTTVAAGGATAAGGGAHALQSLGGLGVATAGLGTARFVGAITVPPTWQGSMPVPAVLTSLAVPALGGQLPTPIATGGSSPSGGGTAPAMPMAMDGRETEDGKTDGRGRKGGENPHVVQARPKVVPRGKRA